MKITAITKFKHGELWAALNKAGWTASELARRSNCSPEKIGRFLNLRAKPSALYCNRIQKAFAEVNIFIDVLSLWPEAFQGLRASFKIEQTQEIEMDHLLDSKEAFMIEAPNSTNQEDLYDAINQACSALSSNESGVIFQRFWNNNTLKKSAKKMGWNNGETARQYQEKALRKLRHPSVLRKIKEAMDL